MLKNYLKIAWRNLLKSKVFSLINILGLSIGIACCFIIGIYILHELSYDRFFPEAKHIYRVVQEQDQASDIYQVAITPAPLGKALKERYPEVKEFTSFTRIFDKKLFKSQDKSFEEGDGLYVDSAFFRLFPCTLQKGSIETFSTNTNTILLTENMAQKYFGEENPVGRVINIDHHQDFVVAGVIQNPNSNSHLKFNFLLPVNNLRSHRDFTSWGNNWMYTYVLLKEKTNVENFETTIKTLLSDNIASPDWQPRLYLQPLTEIHLHSNFDFNTDVSDTGSLQSVYLFGAIGLIIMLISCINFVNLTTAQAFERNKETGIRKVAGANRAQLIFQFVGESLLYVLISMVLAIGITQMVIPYFTELSGSPLAIDLPGIKNLLFLLFAIFVVIGLVTSIYPALFFSGFRAVKILEGNSSLYRDGGTRHFSLKKILVVSQFTLTVVLIISVISIQQQLRFILNRNLGFDKEYVVHTPVKGELGNEAQYQSFKNALLQDPSIERVSRSNSLPIHHEGSFGGVEWEGMPDNHKDFLMNYLEVDEAFIETFGLEIIEGGNFSLREPRDSAAYYIVNEAALKAMQMNDPIGKRLEEGTILGIVKDFNFQSAFSPVEPMMLRSEQGNRYRHIAIRIASGNIEQTIKSIEQIYSQFNPDYPVEYHFLDQSIAALYDQQISSGKLIDIFAALAVFISCMGLFGLATFTTQKRLKEIGVRKVNGAKTWEVIAMLNSGFVKWVMVAFVIACPIAWYVMDNWLKNFAYKIELSWWIFAAAGISALGVATLTVTFQSWRAATKNPVEALRYE